jgi:hypothetical protein
LDAPYPRFFEPLRGLHDEELAQEETRNDQNHASGHDPGLLVGFDVCELHSASLSAPVQIIAPQVSPGKILLKAAARR